MLLNLTACIAVLKQMSKYELTTKTDPPAHDQSPHCEAEIRETC